MNNAHDLVETLRRKAPEYIDLATAATDSEFQAALNAFLEKAVSHLEANKKAFDSLDEVGLSAVLAGSLSMPGLTISQEKQSNGHVDLTIEADHCVPQRKVLGEAKIYNGPAYHVKGIEQLLGRYVTGRELLGLLLVYCRERNISGLVVKLRERMDQDLPCSQRGPTADYVLRWSFSSKHAHSSGDDIQVAHIGCNLCTES